MAPTLSVVMAFAMKMAKFAACLATALTFKNPNQEDHVNLIFRVQNNRFHPRLAMGNSIQEALKGDMLKGDIALDTSILTALSKVILQGKRRLVIRKHCLRALKNDTLRCPSVEPKVRLEGYGYNPFCSHSSRCLAVLVWQYFEEALKVHPKYGWNGTVSRVFPLIALIALGAFFHSTPGSAQSRLKM